MFLQIQFKFKNKVDRSDPAEPKLIVEPTALEVSQMNFFKDGEEKPMETMVAVSLLNMQLDMLVKYLKKREFPLATMGGARELSCMGFKLTDPDFVFYNKFFTIDTDYELVEPDENCDVIERGIK